MAGAGRPTELTDQVLVKIRQGVLDGKTLKEIAEQSGIEINTMYDWSAKNYMNLADKVEGWKRDRKLMLAEKNIEEILQMGTMNTLTRSNGEVYDATDTGILRVKADISKFVAETLGKNNYAKRSELTGKNGDPVAITGMTIT